MGAVQNIRGTDAFSDAVNLMPITNWLMQNFSVTLLGIAILSGVIMYAKFKVFGVGTAA